MQSGTGTRGNTAWNNTVRSRLYLERVEHTNMSTLTRKKANYAKTGEKLDLHWASGAFWQEGSKTADASLEDGDQLLFLACLRQAQDERARVGTNVHGNHVPRTLMKMAKAQGNDVTVSRFEKATRALMKADQIRMDHEYSL